MKMNLYEKILTIIWEEGGISASGGLTRLTKRLEGSGLHKYTIQKSIQNLLDRGVVVTGKELKLTLSDFGEKLLEVYGDLRNAEEKRKIATRELDALISSVRERIREFEIEIASSIPVDRSDVEEPVTGEVYGQHASYKVLSERERSKGFVRPFRDAYRHQSCGQITTMVRSIAETYARDPSFYIGTFCSTCRQHFPVGPAGEFTWYEMDGTEGPKVGT